MEEQCHIYGSWSLLVMAAFCLLFFLRCRPPFAIPDAVPPFSLRIHDWTQRLHCMIFISRARSMTALEQNVATLQSIRY